MSTELLTASEQIPLTSYRVSASTTPNSTILRKSYHIDVLYLDEIRSVQGEKSCEVASWAKAKDARRY